MTLKEIKEKLERISSNLDLLMEDETMVSFPKAFKAEIGNIDKLIDDIEDSETEEK